MQATVACDTSPRSRDQTGAATPRGPDPSWHRRRRKARADARVLLRLGAAARLLSRHHSSGRMAQGDRAASRTAGHSTTWRCSHSKCGQDNYSSRTTCRACGAAKGGGTGQADKAKPPPWKRTASAERGGGPRRGDRGAHRPRESEAERGDQGEAGASASAASGPIGVLPMLPQLAQQHPSWLAAPPIAAGLKQHRESLRKAMVAAAERVRAIRSMPAEQISPHRLQQAENEYAALHCQVILAKDPATRMEKQEQFVNKAKKTMAAAKDAQFAAELAAEACKAETAKAATEYQHAQEFMAQLAQMEHWCAFPGPGAAAPAAEHAASLLARDGMALDATEDGIEEVEDDGYGGAAARQQMPVRPAWTLTGTAQEQARVAKLESQMGVMSEALTQILATLNRQGQQVPGQAAGGDAEQAAAGAKPASQKSAGKGVKPKAFAAPPPQGQRRLAMIPGADGAEAAAKVMKAEGGQPVVVEVAPLGTPSQQLPQSQIPTQRHDAAGDAMQDAAVGQLIGPDGLPLV